MYYNECDCIGATYSTQELALADVQKIRPHWDDVKKELDEMPKGKRQQHWATRKAGLLGLAIKEPQSKYIGVIKSGKGWAALFAINSRQIYLRTHHGDGSEEAAKRDFDAISPHREELREKLKGIVGKDQQRHFVQAYWARLVGCDPPKPRKGWTRDPALAVKDKGEPRVVRRPKDKTLKPGT